MSSGNKSSGSALYISHGGGPLPLLGDSAHRDMVEVLKHITNLVERPAAIIVISAHWEADRPTITGAANPPLIYDYSGFPPESYQIQYPAPGEPSLAADIFSALENAGIRAVVDQQRGFDHGVFVPLKIMYPDADIPCVQLSLLKSLSPVAHIQIGQALAALKNDNVLVLGSGFSFHNMKAFFSPSTAESRSRNEAFEQWLIETCSSPALREAERNSRLIAWENAPAARYCHPREEHLLPLHVCYGWAESPARQVFTFEVLGKQASAYLW